MDKHFKFDPILDSLFSAVNNNNNNNNSQHTPATLDLIK